MILWMLLLAPLFVVGVVIFLMLPSIRAAASCRRQWDPDGSRIREIPRDPKQVIRRR